MAKFNCAALLRKRQFQRLTGVEPALFLDMVERLRTRWQKRVVEPKNRFRVRVEHTFAKIKSFRLFSERLRYSRASYAAKFSAVAGIVNLIAGF